MRDSVDMKPYGFRLPWRLLCHQDSASLSKQGPRTRTDRFTLGFLLDLDGFNIGMPNGGCYFDQFAIFRRIVLVLKLVLTLKSKDGIKAYKVIVHMSSFRVICGCLL